MKTSFSLLLELLYVVGTVEMVASVDVVKLRSSPFACILEVVEIVLVDRSGCSLLDTEGGV